MSAETTYDDVLFFYISDLRGCNLMRVIRHDRAAALYPFLVNPATGLIPEGDTIPRDDMEPSFTIRRASSVGLPAEMTRDLLGLHAQMLDYERNGQMSRCEGYADYLKEWRLAAHRARYYRWLTALA
jgi:hypothetical protein